MCVYTWWNMHICYRNSDWICGRRRLSFREGKNIVMSKHRSGNSFWKCKTAKQSLPDMEIQDIQQRVSACKSRGLKQAPQLLVHWKFSLAIPWYLCVCLLYFVVWKHQAKKWPGKSQKTSQAMPQLEMSRYFFVCLNGFPPIVPGARANHRKAGDRNYPCERGWHLGFQSFEVSKRIPIQSSNRATPVRHLQGISFIVMLDY